MNKNIKQQKDKNDLNDHIIINSDLNFDLMNINEVYLLHTIYGPFYISLQNNYLNSTNKDEYFRNKYIEPGVARQLITNTNHMWKFVNSYDEIIKHPYNRVLFVGLHQKPLFDNRLWELPDSFILNMKRNDSGNLTNQLTQQTDFEDIKPNPLLENTDTKHSSYFMFFKANTNYEDSFKTINDKQKEDFIKEIEDKLFNNNLKLKNANEIWKLFKNDAFNKPVFVLNHQTNINHLFKLPKYDFMHHLSNDDFNLYLDVLKRPTLAQIKQKEYEYQNGILTEFQINMQNSANNLPDQYKEEYVRLNADEVLAPLKQFLNNKPIKNVYFDKDAYVQTFDPNSPALPIKYNQDPQLQKILGYVYSFYVYYSSRMFYNSKSSLLLKTKFNDLNYLFATCFLTFDYSISKYRISFVYLPYSKNVFYHQTPSKEHKNFNKHLLIKSIPIEDFHNYFNAGRQKWSCPWQLLHQWKDFEEKILSNNDLYEFGIKNTKEKPIKIFFVKDEYVYDLFSGLITLPYDEALNDEDEWSALRWSTDHELNRPNYKEEIRELNPRTKSKALMIRDHLQTLFSKYLNYFIYNQDYVFIKDDGLINIGEYVKECLLNIQKLAVDEIKEDTTKIRRR